MQSSYLEFVGLLACLIGFVIGQGLLPTIDESEDSGSDNTHASILQIIKVPPRECPKGQQRVNGVCRTIFTNN